MADRRLLASLGIAAFGRHYGVTPDEVPRGNCLRHTQHVIHTEHDDGTEHVVCGRAIVDGDDEAQMRIHRLVDVGTVSGLEHQLLRRGAMVTAVEIEGHVLAELAGEVERVVSGAAGEDIVASRALR